MDYWKEQEQKLNEQIERNKLNLVGGRSYSDDAADQAQADSASGVEELGAGFYQNVLFNIPQKFSAYNIPADKNFNIEDKVDTLMELGVKQEHMSRFRGAGSELEMNYILADLEDELKAQKIISGSGFSGVASNLLGSIIDADAPMMFMSGGSLLGPKVAGVINKIPKAGKVASIGYGATAGAEAALLTTGLAPLVSQTGSLEYLPESVAATMVFGAGVGALTRLDRLTNKAVDELGKARVKPVEPTSKDVFDHSVEKPVDDSIGAARAAGTGAPEVREVSPDTDKLMEESQRYLDQTDEYTRNSAALAKKGLAALGHKIADLLGKIPGMRTDYDKILNSGSSIAKADMMKLLEDATGLTRNNGSGAVLREKYNAHIVQPFMGNYEKLLREYRAQGGHPASAESAAQFHRDVVLELNSRQYDGVGLTRSSRPVRDAADLWDASMERAQKVLKGRDGEVPVKGANFEWSSGWLPFRWSGNLIDDAVKLGRATEANIIRALESAYRQAHSDWTEEVISKVAKSVVRRARAMEDGISTSVADMLNADGYDFAYKFLTDSGISASEAEALLDGLRKIQSPEKKASVVKHRNDLDPRTPIAGSDLMLSDLMESNLPLMVQKYARQAGGVSAMARHGIQREDISKRVAGALEELKYLGKEGTVTEEDLRGMYDAFLGGPRAGGLNPWVRRMMASANLAVLNTLGLTQAADTAPLIAAYGIQAFKESAPAVVREMMSGQYSPAMKDMADWTYAVEGEHILMRPEMMLDETRMTPALEMEYNDFMTKLGKDLDKGIAKLQRIQGYTSLFYKMKHWQHNMAARSYMQMIGKLANGTKKLSADRLYDMGFTDPAKLESLLDTFRRHVEYRDGVVHSLNAARWNPKDFDEFINVFTRTSAQVTQKALIGEDMLWMHKDIGAVFSSLKQFTIVSMRKQLLRNMRINDPVSAGTFAYGLALGGLVYVAKQTIAGSTENLQADDIAKGAFAMSGMSASIPMFVDPLGSMLGIDSFKFNGYARPGVAGGKILPTPTPLDTAEKMLHIPESTFSVLMGDYNKQDITAMQSIPIIGNLYGFSYMFNSLKKDIDADKARERRARKQEQDTPEEVVETPEPEVLTPVETVNEAVELGQ